MNNEPVEEFCKNDAAPVVRECPDCIDKYIHLAQKYQAENLLLRESAQKTHSAAQKLVAEFERQRDEALQKLETVKADLEYQIADKDMILDQKKALEAEIERLEKAREVDNAVLWDCRNKLANKSKRAQDAELQVRELEKIKRAASRWADAYGAIDSKFQGVQVERDLLLALAGCVEKRVDDHEHVWYADPSRGPGSFCRTCNQVWLPGAEVHAKRCICPNGTRTIIAHVNGCPAGGGR